MSGRLDGHTGGRIRPRGGAYEADLAPSMDRIRKAGLVEVERTGAAVWLVVAKLGPGTPSQALAGR